MAQAAKASPEDVEDVFRSSEKDLAIFSTSEVADRLGVSHPTAGKYLHRLRKRGIVDFEETGSSKVWYLQEVLDSAQNDVLLTDGGFTKEALISSFSRDGFRFRVGGVAVVLASLLLIARFIIYGDGAGFGTLLAVGSVMLTLGVTFVGVTEAKVRFESIDLPTPVKNLSERQVMVIGAALVVLSGYFYTLAGQTTALGRLIWSVSAVAHLTGWVLLLRYLWPGGGEEVGSHTYDWEDDL